MESDVGEEAHEEKLIHPKDRAIMLLRQELARVNDKLKDVQKSRDTALDRCKVCPPRTR